MGHHTSAGYKFKLLDAGWQHMHVMDGLPTHEDSLVGLTNK